MGCKVDTGLRPDHPMAGMQISSDPNQHEAGDCKALLGKVLMRSITVSSLGLVDATEKLMMHLQVLRSLLWAVSGCPC